jgi:hypothetical protein
MLTRPEYGYTSTRLYTLEELREILKARDMRIKQACGGYDVDIPDLDDRLALVIYSEKHKLDVWRRMEDLFTRQTLFVGRLERDSAICTEV